MLGRPLQLARLLAWSGTLTSWAGAPIFDCSVPAGAEVADLPRQDRRRVVQCDHRRGARVEKGQDRLDDRREERLLLPGEVQQRGRQAAGTSLRRVARRRLLLGRRP